MRVMAALAALVALWAQAGGAQAQATLETIKARGHIICGTSVGVPGFSLPDDKGAWSGFDIDNCRSLAAFPHGFRTT